MELWQEQHILVSFYSSGNHTCLLCVPTKFLILDSWYRQYPLTEMLGTQKVFKNIVISMRYLEDETKVPI